MSTTDPRATMVTLFKEGSTYVTAATLNAALETGQSNFKWDAQYAASSYETRQIIEDIFTKRGYDGVYVVTILGSVPVGSASGITSRLKRVGIQPFSMDKRISNNAFRLFGDKAITPMCDVVDTVLDAYYRVSPGDLIDIGGHTYERSVVDGVVAGPVIEAVVQVYLETTSGTSRVTEQLQRWTNLQIGHSGATAGTTYTNLVGGIASFKYGRLHPAWWQDVANTVTATVAGQGHSNYGWELRLSGDCYHAFYTQAVTGAGGSPAMDSDGNSNKILYMRVIAAIRSDAGTSLTRTYTLTNAYALSETLEDGDYVYTGIAGDISRADA